jgi:succinate dehydrogenase / fumarate reductase cytochrome b subunit
MAETKAGRPLSPHLQIYRPMLTMLMSIAHRITGSALYVGTLLFAWWLIALAAGPEAFDVFQGFIGSVLGRLVLFAFTWALFHHMLGGLRHLLWDTGRGFGLGTIEALARLTLVGGFALALAAWAIGYAVR